ncbi:pollen-specific leucine-rich repeat extensin-like protein 1 [Varroa destructor]|uniref:RRM domain-containing protein n=1 Tax=Varroa destructor TaxID=109461 RepID=A0A7M7MBV8_VARDE|nr:pollen-specific leucine-rich repeat extensin-like protein 1 [Varroa destructor]
MMSMKEDDLLADDDGGLCLKDDYDDDALLDGEDDLLGPDPSEAGPPSQAKEPPPPAQVPVALVAPAKSVRVETVVREEPLKKAVGNEPAKPELAPQPMETPVVNSAEEKPKEKEKPTKELNSSNEEANESESDDETQLKVIVHQHRVREQVRDEDDDEEQPRGRSSRFQQERVISTRGGKLRQGIPDSLESVEIPTIGGHHHSRHQQHHQQQQHSQSGINQSNQFQPRGGLRGRGGRFRHDRPRPYGDSPRGRAGIRAPSEHHPRPRHQGPLLRFPPNVQPNNTSPTSNRGGANPAGSGVHGGHGGHPGSNSSHHQQLAPPPVPPNLNLPPPGFPPPGLPLPPPPLNGPPPPLPPLGGPPLQFPPPPLLPPPPISLPPPAFPPNAPPPPVPPLASMFTNLPPPLPPPNLSVPPPPIGGHPATILPAANKPGQKIYVNKNFRPPPTSAPEVTGYTRFDTSIPPPPITSTGHLTGGYRERSRSPVYRSPPRYRSPPPRDREITRSRDRRDRSRSRSRDRDDNWASRDRDRDYHRDSRIRDRLDSRVDHRYRECRELSRVEHGGSRDKRDVRQRSPPPSKEPSRPLDEFELKLLEQKKERERVLKMKEERRRQAVRERLSKQQQSGTDKGQGQPGLNGRPQKLAAGTATVAIADSKETKEEKQKRQVILTNVDDTLDERRLGEAFSKFDVERMRILRDRKAAFVFLRNPRDAETFCRRNPEFSVGPHVLKVSYAVELAKKRNDAR